MSTQRGWQATVGEMDAVLRHLDIAQGAEAQVRDGQLWIRHHPTQPWVAAVRIPAALAARARRWVATYVAAATQGAPPATASPTSHWRSRESDYGGAAVSGASGPTGPLVGPVGAPRATGVSIFIFTSTSSGC